jgi:hypothetical protein
MTRIPRTGDHPAHGMARRLARVLTDAAGRPLLYCRAGHTGVTCGNRDGHGPFVSRQA